MKKLIDTNLKNEIIESIENIDSVVMESEMNIICTLIDAYSKASIIMENCDDVSVFNIFQEGVIDDAKGDPSESLFIRIIKFIPRLIMSLIKSIKNVWDNRKSQQLIQNIEKLKNISEEQCKRISDLEKKLDDFRQDTDDSTQKSDKEAIRKLQRAVDVINAKINASSNKSNYQDISVDDRALIKELQLSSKINNLSELVDVIHGVVKSKMDFQIIVKFLNETLTLFESLKSWDMSVDPTVPSEIKEEINRIKTYSFDKSDVTTPSPYKYDDVKSYIDEITSLKNSICKIGQEFVNSYKYQKPTNPVQTDDISDARMLVDDVRKIVQDVQQLYRSVEYEFDILNTAFQAWKDVADVYK
jgi:hypothetical protein